MIRAAIVGLGWWGQTLIEAAAASAHLRFTVRVSRHPTAEIESLAKDHGLRLVHTFEDAVAASEVDAVVLATPPTTHAGQVVAGWVFRRHDARLWRILGGTPDHAVWYVQIPARPRRGPGVAGGRTRHHSRNTGCVCRGCRRGAAFLIPVDEMVHGAAVTEAVIRSRAVARDHAGVVADRRAT